MDRGKIEIENNYTFDDQICIYSGTRLYLYVIYRTMFPTFYEKSCEQEIHGILRAPSLRVKLNETCEITFKGHIPRSY